jgi:hypothetical protein
VNYGVRGRLKSIISHCGDTHALASRLHIFIQTLILFTCFGCVVINHQKGGDCKENGPRAIWLIEFWCLMINTIRKLISFSSVYVCSSQDARITWSKELRKATPQNKTLRRSRKVQERRCVLPVDCLCVEHRTVRWHTGLSGGTPDCPVAHRTVRCPHAGLSGAPGNHSPTASSRCHPERRAPDCPV